MRRSILPSLGAGTQIDVDYGHESFNDEGAMDGVASGVCVVHRTPNVDRRTPDATLSPVIL